MAWSWRDVMAARRNLAVHGAGCLCVALGLGGQAHAAAVPGGATGWAGEAQRAALAQLQADLAHTTQRTELTLLPLDLSPATFDGVDAVQARPSGATRPAPRMSIRVELRRLGAPLRQVDVPIAVRAWAPALVATRPLRAGHVLQPGDLQGREVDATELREALWAPSEGDVLQWALTQDIGQGTALRARQVTRHRAVRPGERVLLSLHHGAVTLQTPGHAQQAGDVGQLIRVRPLQSNQPIWARVERPGHALAVEGHP